VLIHTPHRDKLKGTLLTLQALKDNRFPMELALVDHNTEETLPHVLASGAWAGHSIYPETKMDEHRMVALVQRYGGDKALTHYEVVVGINEQRRRVLLLDPGRGPREDGLDTFDQEWRDAGRLALVVAPS